MRSVELIEEIECDKKELRELEDKLRRLKIDIKVREKELEKVKKQEIIELEISTKAIQKKCVNLDMDPCLKIG